MNVSSHQGYHSLFRSNLVKHANIPSSSIISFLKCTVCILKSKMLQKVASFGDMSSFYFHLKYHFSTHEDVKSLLFLDPRRVLNAIN